MMSKSPLLIWERMNEWLDAKERALVKIQSR